MKTAGFLCLLLASAVASAGGGAAPTPQTSARTSSYVCDGGAKVSVAYIQYGKAGTSFAVLNWNGAQYGLASAISGSGARYAALAGPEGARGGLEWWEHGGEATLSAFVDGTMKTRALLTGCKTSG